MLPALPFADGTALVPSVVIVSTMPSKKVSLSSLHLVVHVPRNIRIREDRNCNMNHESEGNLRSYIHTTMRLIACIVIAKSQASLLLPTMTVRNITQMRASANHRTVSVRPYPLVNSMYCAEKSQCFSSMEWPASFAQE